MPEKDRLPLALCGLYILRPLIAPGWGLLWGRAVVVWKLLKALLVSQVRPGSRLEGGELLAPFPDLCCWSWCGLGWVMATGLGGEWLAWRDLRGARVGFREGYWCP